MAWARTTAPVLCGLVRFVVRHLSLPFSHMLYLFGCLPDLVCSPPCRVSLHRIAAARLPTATPAIGGGGKAASVRATAYRRPFSLFFPI